MVNESSAPTAATTLRSTTIEESAIIASRVSMLSGTTMSPENSLIAVAATPEVESTSTETISLSSLLLQTIIFSSVTSESGASTTATIVSESDDSSIASTMETDDDSDASLAQPPSDSLTKGFSIPTFLPPFPEFAVADLPSYTVTPATTKSTMSSSSSLFAVGEPLGSMSPDMLQQQQDQLYLDAYNKQHVPKKNLTIPATNVTVQMGSHAYMPCHIRRLMNKPVSWVRVRDGHILSVDQTTFIADQRFQSIFKGENEYTWSLQIKYVHANDEGWYECQVSTEPKMSAKVYLGVVVPKTELIGDQNRFVKAGSKVALHCIVRGTLEPPTYIIWFRGKTQLTDDMKMGWYTQIDRNIFGNTSDNQNTIGSLIIPFVKKTDSGNYTCQPSNSAAVSVDLHVLSGEYSASAIMSAARTYQLNTYFLLLILLLLGLQRT